MISEEVSLLSKIISVWGWHLLAWMFFLKSLGFLVTKRYMWFFGLMGVCLICELVALSRKRGLQNESK